MIRELAFATLLSVALPALGQSVPATNYTDMWWNPAESGWGVSFTQHAASNQVFAIWYTYDPREAGSTAFKPLWIVMPGGTWTSPTSLTGTVYVTNGKPFTMAGTNQTNTAVGSFTFAFTNSSNGQFAYNIVVPAGLAATDPAFNLPPMSGVKTITRQSF
jgi:hypothetical protein